MDYKSWSELKRNMAVEIFAMNAAEVMTPYAQAREAALAIMARSDAAKSPEEQGDRKVQNWRGIEYSAGQALIALQKLGYVITRAQKDTPNA